MIGMVVLHDRQYHQLRLSTLRAVPWPPLTLGRAGQTPERWNLRLVFAVSASYFLTLIRVDRPQSPQ